MEDAVASRNVLLCVPIRADIIGVDANDRSI